MQVVRFNPWLFSGTEQLVSRFFAEVAATLRIRDKALSKELAPLLQAYGELLEPLSILPGVGGVGTAMKTVGSFLDRRSASKSTEEKRSQLRQALSRSTKRLVFVLDDIDRLNDEEIRDVMRLVRLVGDFPNCIYLLAFDRKRVEQALGLQVGGDGHAYLEKILQVVHEVPPVRRSDLGRILTTNIQQVTEGIQHGPFDEELWQNVFVLGMFPLFRKMRDVRRYLNGVALTLESIGEEVAVVDVLALETIRILEPAVFAMIPEAVEALTTPSSDLGQARPKDEQHKKLLEQMLDAATDKDAVKQLLTRLFPACQQHLQNMHFGPEWSKEWSKNRRVAHERMLRFYLEKSYPEHILPNTTIRKFFESLGDERGLRELLSELTNPQLEEIVSRLEDFEDDYPIESVEPAIAALFSQLHRVTDDRSLWLGFSAEMKLHRVIYRLLKRLKSEQEREKVVTRLFAAPDISLRGKRILVLMSGHQKNVGHGFISAVVADRLEADLSAMIASAEGAALATEGDLIRLCVWVRQHGTDQNTASLRMGLVHRDAFLSLLKSAMTESQSQTLGDAAIGRDKRLAWKTLGDVVGEDDLVQRVKNLVANGQSMPDGYKETVDLALRYADGWRPSDRFGGED